MTGPRRQKPRSRRLPLAARLVIGVLIALALLSLGAGGTELVLRLRGVQVSYEAPWKGAWRSQPNLTNHRMPTHEDQRGFVINTNGDGLRTSLHPQKTPGVLRLALLGDSTVFGWGVDDGYTLADSVRRALARKPGPWVDGARKVELLNAAQPGYTSTQATWLFERVVAAYKPDRVLLFVPLHDYNLVLVSDREAASGGSDLAAGARVWLARHCRIYTLLRRQLFPMHQKQYLMPNATPDEPRVPRVSNAERQQNFDRLRQLLSGWGGKLMLGYMPTYIDLTHAPDDQYIPRRGEKWVYSYSKKHAVPMVDVRDCCGPNADQALLPNDRGHLSAMGNAMVGAAVARGLAPHLRASSKKKR